MADPNETTIIDVFDRLRKVETKQEVFEVKYIEILKSIDKKLDDITAGRNANCLEHKAELVAMRLVADTLRKDFDDYKAVQLQALQEQERAIRARYNLIWAALVMGTSGLVFQAVPWLLRAAVGAAGG